MPLLSPISFLVGKVPKIDYRFKKGTPYSNLSTGGPSLGLFFLGPVTWLVGCLVHCLLACLLGWFVPVF